MKTFKYEGKTYELDFSFNSIILLEDLDLVGIADELKQKPLKMLGITVTLLWGALNKDGYLFEKSEVANMLQKWSQKSGNNIMELFVSLQEALEKSDFFQQMFNEENSQNPLQVMEENPNV